MRITTLIQFLLGRRHAILEIANCPNAVWLGFLFVFSAAFAREYDGEDLVHQPWYLLIPLGASLVTSFLLFSLLEAAFPAPDGAAQKSFWGKYRSFLGLYWMTAPLAWLYAIPVERFLGEGDAVRANLAFLGIVAAWRVVLMIRVASVFYGQSTSKALCLVMLLADTVLLAVVWLTPLPILSVMGGIRLSESEQVIQSVGFLVRFAATATWPIWLISSAFASASSKPGQVSFDGNRPGTVAWGLWGLAAFSLAIWSAILPYTQEEQINRRFVEWNLRAGFISEAIDYMSQRQRDQFPPHWDPPPRIGYGERKPLFVDVIRRLNDNGVAAWVRDLYRQKLVVQSLSSAYENYGHAIVLGSMTDDQIAGYARFLASIPEGPAMAQYHRFDLDEVIEPRDGNRNEISEVQKSSILTILRLLPERNMDLEEKVKKYDGTEPTPESTAKPSQASSNEVPEPAT